MILPVREIKNNYSKKTSNKTIFCFAYQEDLNQAYAFYCSRYENISYKEFMQLGLFEFKKKLGSVPKTEPLYDIIKFVNTKIIKRTVGSNHSPFLTSSNLQLSHHQDSH